MVHARSFGTLTDAVDRAVSGFGAAVTAKLKGPGHREDQLRGPVDEFLKAVAGAMNLRLVAHGEVPLPDRTAIPDYVVCIDKLPIGHVELKAPGKGVDPGRWSPGSHDRHQWERLSLLPNILYTDGDSWALYRAGQRIGRIARVRGSVESSGARLQPADGELLRVLADFLEWVPQPPGDLDRLVKNVAGLCSLLRDEVRVTLRNERAGDRETEFASLVHDWRRALFPRLNDDQFADAYAQTVTFALLLARVENIHFEDRTVEEIARLLGKSHSLMGKALDVLTPGWVLGRVATTIETLRRVIGTVHWDLLDDGTGSAYLTLYEQFLAVYDSELRKQTGSYFTPSAVVSFMVRFVDDVLRTRLGLRDGFAAPDLCVVDPAMGTGTFLVEIIDQVARTASVDGEVVRAKLRELAERLVGFEKQACPYAVAELRVAEAMRHHRTELPAEGMCLYVADALDAVDTDNLLDEFGEPLKRRLGSAYEPIERSKREADKIKSTRHVEVVIGNPPYLERAKGLGGWIERGSRSAQGVQPPPLDSFRADGEGKHQYKLSNMYIYFWRWGTWKAFDAHPKAPTGVVAFISAASYVAGKGFAGVREYLRSTADEGWIIDLSPEEHRPPVPTRLFPSVSQPLCIGIFARYNKPSPRTPATVHYLAVHGTQAGKFDRLQTIHLGDPSWKACSTVWRAPLKPPAEAGWASYPQWKIYSHCRVWVLRPIVPGSTTQIRPICVSAGSGSFGHPPRRRACFSRRRVIAPSTNGYRRSKNSTNRPHHSATRLGRAQSRSGWDFAASTGSGSSPMVA